MYTYMYTHIALQQSELHPLLFKIFVAIIFEMLSMSLNSQEFVSNSVICPHHGDLGMLFVILNWSWYLLFPIALLNWHTIVTRGIC